MLAKIDCELKVRQLNPSVDRIANAGAKSSGRNYRAKGCAWPTMTWWIFFRALA